MAISRHNKQRGFLSIDGDVRFIPFCPEQLCK